MVGRRQEVQLLQGVLKRGILMSFVILLGLVALILLLWRYRDL